MGIDSLPLSGIRVIELAQWVFVPSASAILAELGADVVRIEHPTQGDPYRALATSGYGNSGRSMSIRSAQVNRGKRSIGIDLSIPEGKALAHRLIASADVFMTSFRAGALERLNLTQAEVEALNPGIVYARGDAFGPLGPDSAAPGYDITAFWARGGIGALVTDPESARIAKQPPSFGDRIASLGLAAGILGALVGKVRTGRGGEVSSSLMAAAAWVGASDMLTGEAPKEAARPTVPATPLTTSYRCSDGRHLMINLMQSERYWSDFCKAIGAEELTVDPRFLDFAARAGHPDELHAEIAGRIGAAPLSRWREVFADFDGPWAPVQTVHEAAQDPQVRANAFLLAVDDGSGEELVRAPFTVGEVPQSLPRAHELGEDTEVVLLEFGVAWEEIEDLKAHGAVT
ncbi:CoA transferase [Nocardioides sp. BP30]|uniref:CaiB/BaiF CoA transferase family protein n=1 Tax=Nocardioides sp. BP30 TaxID=3036374 RepID=UPI002468464A|nr:CoA transferase [Nocardioides sp. BP30]WGL54133.1 CoA transferase [Nocardioides sp. BP30]